MSTKQRLSASGNAEHVPEAQSVVSEGRTPSVSALVDDALRLKADHDRRMRALDSFLAAFEAQHGVITDADVGEAGRRAQARATVVRSAPEKTPTRSDRGAARA